MSVILQFFVYAFLCLYVFVSTSVSYLVHSFQLNEYFIVFKEIFI